MANKLFLKVKNILKVLWSSTFTLLVKLFFRFLIPESYQSEIIYFQKLRWKNYDDVKYLESRLRNMTHQIDKTLTLKSIKRFDIHAGNVMDLIGKLEARSKEESESVRWAKDIIKIYNARVSEQTTPITLQHEEYTEKIDKSILSKLIKTRRSVRSFKSKKITFEKIKEILEMGLAAPTGCNRQNIEFLILERVEDIIYCQKLAGEGYSFPSEASFAIIVLADCRTYALPGQRHQAFLETGAAIQNMLLYAHALNISSTWLNWAGLEKKNKKFRHKYGLPEWLLPTALVCFGYANIMPPLVPVRKSIEKSIYKPLEKDGTLE